MANNAPTNLDLSGCSFSADGGKTTVTGAQVIQNQNTQSASIAQATQDASDAKAAATTANQTASQASNDAKTAITVSKSSIPNSLLTGGTAGTGVVSVNNGTVVLGAGSFENNSGHPEYFPGQGPIVGWNDKTGQCATLWANINPGQGSGGHRFFEMNTGFDPSNFDVKNYAVAWNWKGNASFGIRGASTALTIGRQDCGNWNFLRFFSASKSYMAGEADEWGLNAGDAAIISTGGDGTGYTASLLVRAADLSSASDGTTNLGSASNRFDNLFLAGTVNQTSDATEKTVIGKITDKSFVDSEKLISLYDKLTPVVYKYNSAITDKGISDARFHVGNIAQDVKSAFTAVGLDASQWSIWSEEKLSENVRNSVKNEDGSETVTYENKPILDENGNQRTRQALNYIDLLMLYTACAQSKITDITMRVSALETKVGGNA